MKELCRHFGTCGGCDSQDKPYEEQLKAKESSLKELFSRFDIKEFRDIIPSPEIFNYRNKMEFAVGSDGGDLFIGLRQKRRFYRIVDLEECRIFRGGVKTIFDIFKSWIREYAIEPYQARRHTGDLRYAAMRHSKHYDELMIIIVTASPGLRTGPLVDKLKTIDGVKSVYLCVNGALADVAVTDRTELLYGERYIRERINGIDYLIGPDSFFQTNPYCCSRLYSLIKEEASGIGGEAIDLCCGSGGIALQVAGDFTKVTGVDISEHNIDDARVNNNANGIKNVEFVKDDAEKYLMAAAGSNAAGRFSTIIVDPPRAGLSKKAKAAILQSPVRNMIYVSCNPVKLAEDLDMLKESYGILSVTPVDMFPHTRHVEVVAILKSNKV